MFSTKIWTLLLRSGFGKIHHHNGLKFVLSFGGGVQRWQSSSSSSSSNTKNVQHRVELEYKPIDKSKFDVLFDQLQQWLNSGSSSEQQPPRFATSFITNHAQLHAQIDEILQQYEYLKYINGKVPSDLTVEQMVDLLVMNNEQQRNNYFRYLCITESRKLKDMLKRKRKHDEFEQFVQHRSDTVFGIWIDENYQQELNYKLWGNTLMTRITARHLSHLRTESRLRWAAQFGQPLILDLDYDDHMSLSECRIQVRHIVQTLVQNISYTEPYNIYFTNCSMQKPTMCELKQKYLHTTPFAQMDWHEHFRSENYTNIGFPRDRLVYLSPNASESMTSYNHDDIYIVGGFLDKSCLNKPLSHLKATKDGIRQYRLPLDEHVIWGSGSSKHLCIMHMVAILNELKQTGDWRQSLMRHIPKRKMKDQEILLREQEAQRIAYLRRKLSIENDYFSVDHHSSRGKQRSK